MRNSKMLIFGGTFDPIHMGHLIIANRIKEKYHFSKVFFLPSGMPPHKANTFSDKEDRLTLLKLAIQDNPSFEVLDLEIKKDGYSYTIDTIEEIEKRYNYPDITFLMGADMFMTINTWKRHSELLDKIDIIVASRSEPNMKQLKKQIKKEHNIKIKFFNDIETNISSTYIRDKIKMYESVKYLVPSTVEKYIIRNNLYLDQEDIIFNKIMNESSLNLTSNRRLHIDGVIQMALEIGAYHEIPFEKIRIAAGAHDIAKDYSLDECKKYIVENDIEVDPRATDDFRLMHGHIASKMLENMYDIKDDDVLLAVKNHTFGRKNMSDLELLISVADAVEPNRSFSEDDRLTMDNIKEVAKISLSDAYFFKLDFFRNKFAYKSTENNSLNNEVYEYYKNLYESKGELNE
ncbi:MAG: nicotinate (nicotinamide) nucleotide adenylyltransferase [Lachnospirales bacterium]